MKQLFIYSYRILTTKLQNYNITYITRTYYKTEEIIF